MEIDQTGQEELLKTLYYYLILGRSGSEAADALCIHRNTLRYRINKIKSILSIDINQPDVINQLLASFIIIGKNFIKKIGTV
jgi:DNA-binding PucR family transcriptional regulator